ncbi:FecR family protein [Mesorhizobium koreense]|uniref:FecR family protein n=1 Tax=Mesorhizobium koreense TaxID=3074855 RepID=UPI00287BB787|nr:FecR domain-containing protein [Mesorhizobium sp. WR6]
MRRSVFVLCCLVAIAQPLRAAEQIGVTVDARLRVVSAGQGGGKLLVTSAPVFRNDRLIANASGLAQIRLADDTKLVVGPYSNIILDKFVFSGVSTAKSVSVALAKGAFRFISGHSGSQAYSINTPVGTIGVRGTAFDVSYRNGAASVLLLRGQVRVCPRNGKCEMVRSPCQYVTFNSRGFLRRGSVAGLTEQRRNLFPLLSRSRDILPSFKGNSAGCNSSTPDPGLERTDRSFAPPAPGQPVAPAPSNPGNMRGNPGNTKGVGNAGQNPSGRGFGNPGRGRSDAGINGLAASVAGGFSVGSTSVGASSGSGGHGGGGGANGNGNGGGNGASASGGNGNGAGNGNGNGGGNGNGNGGGNGNGSGK